MSHADVDLLGELKVSSLLGFLEQAAIEASAEAGFDPARYAQLGGVWLVRRTHLERLVSVGGGDSLTISTHIADLRRARSLRNYDVRRGGGYEKRPAAPAVRARTDWVYFDIERRRPSSVPDEMKQALFGDLSSTGQKRPPPVQVPGDRPPATLTTKVRPTHLDHMLHVNNAIWVDFLEDGGFTLFESLDFGVEQMLEQEGALRIRSLDVEYLADAGLGEELLVHSWLEEAPSQPLRRAVLLQAIDRTDGRRLVRARSTWQWRAKPATLGGIPED